mmetsp:Transcript_5564/g.11004  ORF Transcript_5564/g.11004 Transcript_5564/m.11004 type:complete len:263 (-) Transcript_5564:2628-3416(-)
MRRFLSTFEGESSVFGVAHMVVLLGPSDRPPTKLVPTLMVRLSPPLKLLASCEPASSGVCGIGVTLDTGVLAIWTGERGLNKFCSFAAPPPSCALSPPGWFPEGLSLMMVLRSGREGFFFFLRALAGFLGLDCAAAAAAAFVSASFEPPFVLFCASFGAGVPLLSFDDEEDTPVVVAAAAKVAVVAAAAAVPPSFSLAVSWVDVASSALSFKALIITRTMTSWPTRLASLNGVCPHRSARCGFALKWRRILTTLRLPSTQPK